MESANKIPEIVGRYFLLVLKKKKVSEPHSSELYFGVGLINNR